jgi:hypothetical protein
MRTRDRRQGSAADRHASSGRISIRPEGADWLFSARREWDDLLSASDANPLFMGWLWQSLWWKHFGRGLRADALILTARDDSNRLVAIAPFFQRRTSWRKALHFSQLAPIGNVWRTNVGEVTEHNDWIVRRGSEQVACDALCRFVADDIRWDQLLFSYAGAASLANSSLTTLADASGWYVRRERPLPHYSVDTSVPFDEFAKHLGRNTRQRVLTRRKLLHGHGDVAIVYADEANLSVQLQKLEALTKKRWSSEFSRSLRQFYQDLSAQLMSAGQLRLSTLEVGGTPISALFDVEVQRNVYNIRSAIDTRFDRRLSPGLLHLGYAIEHACSGSASRYALLAGGGKRTDYKSNVADISGEFTSLQIVRRTPDKQLYRLHDACRVLVRGK